MKILATLTFLRPHLQTATGVSQVQIVSCTSPPHSYRSAAARRRPAPWATWKLGCEAGRARLPSVAALRVKKEKAAGDASGHLFVVEELRSMQSEILQSPVKALPSR